MVTLNGSGQSEAVIIIILQYTARGGEGGKERQGEGGKEREGKRGREREGERVGGREGGREGGGEGGREGGRGRVGVGLSEDGKRKEEPSSYGSPARSCDRYSSSCYIIYTLPLHVSRLY